MLLDLGKAPFDTKDAKLVPEAGSCVDCPKRTGNATLLFADVREKDRCTDPACYGRKLERHIDVTIEELTKRGKKAVRISAGYDRPEGLPADVLTSKQYDRYIGREDCEGLASGVMVDGWEAGKVFRVCLTKGCKLHGGNRHASPREAAEQAAKREAARRLGEVENGVRYVK